MFFPLVWTDVNSHKCVNVKAGKRTAVVLDALRWDHMPHASCVNVKQGWQWQRACFTSSSAAEVQPNIWDALISPWSWCRSKRWAQSLCSPAGSDQKSKPLSSRLQTISRSVCLRPRHVDTTQARCNGIDLHRQSAPVSRIDTSITSVTLGQCSTDCKLSRLWIKVRQLQQQGHASLSLKMSFSAAVDFYIQYKHNIKVAVVVDFATVVDSGF